MAKLTLNNITSGYASTTALNDNFDLIETALENTLSRDGTSPNQMNADLDMNGYRILNELATSGDGFIWKGQWLTSTAYAINNLVIEAGTTYICKVAHTSGTFSTDLTAVKWEILASKGSTGAGTGDLLAANNLSELTATAATVRSNITAAKSGANSDITSLAGFSSTGDITMSGASIFDANASVAAHATTMDPWSAGNYVTLTGSAVTFTGMAAAPQAGAEVELYMNAAHVFTDGAVFEVDGNANFTATAGDRVLIRAKSTTVFTVRPRKADGTSVVAVDTGAITLGTTQASTSGTAINFTGIPSGTKSINIMFDGVSTSGTSVVMVQIGISTGIENTGYTGSSSTLGVSTTNWSSGAILSSTSAATVSLRGFCTLVLLDSSTNTWAFSGNIGRSDDVYMMLSGGTKSLAGVLDRVRITTASGTDTFDAGNINISYQ